MQTLNCLILDIENVLNFIRSIPSASFFGIFNHHHRTILCSSIVDSLVDSRGRAFPHEYYEFACILPLLRRRQLTDYDELWKF